ncbi:MAG: hypothetical protein OXU21_04220 [Chloroflexota bacterium]|nr:hypothetical protein [Chloroflexota bacterium]
MDRVIPDSPATSTPSRLVRALSLDAERRVRDGSVEALADAIRRGADLHIGTEFRHNEHVDTSSDSPEVVREFAEFRTTYLIEDRWTAGIMTLRQPVSLPEAFGPRPSMSFFLYNQDGTQAIARPHLDGRPSAAATGAAPIDSHPDMPKYHVLDSWDAETNAPSSTFIYDFEHFDFLVRDNWTEVLAHDAAGTVVHGSPDALGEVCADGGEVKAAVRGLCADLAEPGAAATDHEVFVQVGSSYYYTEQRLFIAGTHPLPRVRASIPLRYATRAWDFGWLILRADGRVIRRICDPYTLRFQDGESRHAIRWFVR